MSQHPKIILLVGVSSGGDSSDKFNWAPSLPVYSRHYCFLSSVAIANKPLLVVFYKVDI